MEGCAILPVLTPEWSVTLTRAHDLVMLRFEFANLALQNVVNGSGKEIASPVSGLGYIIVHFQRQHFLEQALDEIIYDVASPPATPPPPVNALISGESRVVLKVPAGAPAIPYSSQGLLDALRIFEMSVAPNATPSDSILPPGGGGLGGGRGTAPALPQVRPRAPVNGETALELPFRLLMSPNYHARWVHEVTDTGGFKQGRYELWHARLGTLDTVSGAVTEAESALRTVRAIWTRDWDNLPNNADTLSHDPFGVPTQSPTTGAFGLQSLYANQRHAIVHHSSNYLDWSATHNSSYVPKPIDAEQLMLTSLGGWLKAHANFGLDAPIPSVIAWDHLAAFGRDYFVKVVARGRLYPWGHAAVLIQITERKFRQPSPNIAYLFQRWFIQIIEPERTYPDTWRTFPFLSVTFKTLITPNLDIPNPSTTEAKPVRTLSGPFRFKLEGIDRDGKVIPFDAVASWLPDNLALTPTTPDVLKAKGIFHGTAPAPSSWWYAAADRASSLGGQRITYAESNKANDTTYETVSINWGSTLSNDPPTAPFPASGGLPFVSSLEQAQLNVEAIRHLIGQEDVTSFSYNSNYLTDGFGGSNKGELLFNLVGGALKADFSKKQGSSGGFVDPSMTVQGLSRATQLVSDMSGALSGSFDPTQFMPDARLFGVVKLKDIIPLGELLKDAPNFVTQQLDVVRGFMEDGDALSNMANDLWNKVKTSAATAATHLQALATALANLITQVGDLLTTAVSDPDKLDDDINKTKTDIDALKTAMNDVLNDVETLPDVVLKSEKEDLKRRVTQIENVLDDVKTGLDAFAKGLEMVRNLKVKFEWRTPLQHDSDNFFVPRTADPKGGFLLAVEVRGKQIGNNPPGFSVVAGVENFTINVFGSAAKLVAIPFKHVLFKVESGKKPDIDVQFDGEVGFDGVLAFVKTLAELIPGGGFSDPPSIEVDAEGIRASFSVPIPSIAVGVFSIQNMRIGAGFEVPFIGNPLSVSFFFCTRDEPFIMTVMCVGGGGFVNLKISPLGMLLLEAALEARAQLAVDFGIASGSISIAVGVYFRLEITPGSPDKQSGEITGYLRFQGCVDVLGGLISACITLLLEFTYEFESQKLVGRATLTIEVSVCFFSFSVSVSVERKLAGSGSDPTFLDQFAVQNLGTPQEYDPWKEYLESFVLAA